MGETPKTEAELALARKYEEMRRKKEAKLKAKQQKKNVPTEAPAAKPAAVASRPKPGQLQGAKKPVAAGRAAPAPKAAEPSIPGETARARAIRLMKSQREAKGLAASQPARAAAAKPAAEAQPSDKPTIPKRPAASRGGATADRQRPAAESHAAERPSDAETPAEPQLDAQQRAIAAQQAARQKQKQQRQGGGAAEQQRPALKRPSAHRPAARQKDGDDSAKRPRHTEQHAQDGEAERRGDDDARASTLFVGDLPPHFDSEAVAQVFVQLAPVAEARVVGTQCYAFVKFESRGAAEHVMKIHYGRRRAFVKRSGQAVTPLTRSREAERAPLEVSGRHLRLNWAHGQLPEWKQGSEMLRTRAADPTGDPGLEQYEHPKVREARLAAQAAADAFDPAQLAEVDLRPPPARTLVVYDDL